MSAQARTAPQWERMRNRPLTAAETQAVREFYDGSYLQRQNYSARHPWNEMIADWRVQLTQAVFHDLGKVLDAGCAAGAEVAAFRRAGHDAWGFDLCPDLADVAYPEAREFVRMGRLDFVPYARADGFKTCVSHDVFEHVPIDVLERFPAELVRLGVTQLSLIVSKDTVSPGHITIQDTAWYVDLFRRSGYRLRTELTPLLAPVEAPVGWDHTRGEPIVAPYVLSGAPRNAWNEVPGHLFFVRE